MQLPASYPKSGIRICQTISVLIAAMLLAAAALPAQEAERGGVAARTPRAQVAGSAQLQVAVASRALQRGDTLRAHDFSLIDTTITWRWSMPSTESANVQAGWIVQRAINAGEVLRSPSVQPPAVITGGSPVKVIYRDGPVQITVTGTAIASATLGAPVSVRVDRTRRIEGIAIGPNTVRLR